MSDEKSSDQVKTEKKGIFDNKITLFGIIIVLQLLIAFVVIQFWISPKFEQLAKGGIDEDQTAANVQVEGVLIDLQEMVVTLNDSGSSPGFLKIRISLEMADSKFATVAKNRLPKLRDSVILTLSNKSSQEMRSAIGKEQVKTEIANKMQQMLPTDSLLGIYFSDLVIQ